MLCDFVLLLAGCRNYIFGILNMIFSDNLLRKWSFILFRSIPSLVELVISKMSSAFHLCFSSGARINRCLLLERNIFTLSKSARQVKIVV